MALEFMINRLKALVLIIMGVFRRALCCLRRRRRSSCDSIPLSAVGVVVPTKIVNNRIEHEHWDQWDDNSIVIIPNNNKPVNTVQSKIEQYRQQIIRPPSNDTSDEPQVNYFENMTPRITKQKKILLTSSSSTSEESSMNLSKFAVTAERLPTKDLEVWDDNAVGWEEETSEEFGDPTHELREQKRRERERRLYEQQQKRIEYNNFKPQSLGEKIIS